MFPPSSPTQSFPYTVESIAGEGAMGIVYRAHEVGLDRPVAIKIMRPGLLAQLSESGAQEVLHRFIQEARAAAAVSHPAITAIYRIGKESGTPYIAMEWLTGQNYEDYLRRNGPIGEAEAIEVGKVVLSALAVAHRNGIVHRDVKPANLMRLVDSRLKVTDFGVASVQTGSLVRTLAGQIVGTPHYASPEQLKGESVDPRADLYSVGAVLYEMVTGRPPFDANTLMRLFELIATEAPASPRSLRPELSLAFERLLLKALSKDRAARFQNSDEMAAALDELANSGDLPAPEPEPDPQFPGPHDTQIVTDGPSTAQLLANAVATWPGRELADQPTATLLDRLFDRPLHTPAFAGGVEIEGTWILIRDGFVYGAWNPVTGACGDVVIESLPLRASATLHPVPPGLDPDVTILMASLLRQANPRLKGLDPSITHIPKLLAKLGTEHFDGVVRFAFTNEEALFLVRRGEVIAEIVGRDWVSRSDHRPWPKWIASASATVSVEEMKVEFLAISYRRELADAMLSVAEPADGDQVQERILVSGEGARGKTTMRGLLGSDPAFGLVGWLLNDSASFFDERGISERWKYLTEWLPLTRVARLHHALPRPASAETDTFDVVTFDEGGKVLCLADITAAGTPEAIEAFIERVTTAKRARIKTGDVGAAILVAPSFDGAARALYDGETSRSSSKSWIFGMQRKITKYGGFIRLGATRGFHLLLVEVKPTGLTPILPR